MIDGTREFLTHIEQSTGFRSITAVRGWMMMGGGDDCVLVFCGLFQGELFGIDTSSGKELTVLQPSVDWMMMGGGEIRYQVK